MFNETGRMVVAIRNLKGINQAQLAKSSEIDRAYISRFERGLQTLSGEHIAEIERALGVSFDEVRPAFEQFATAVLDDFSATATTVLAGDGQEAHDAD